MFMYFPHKCTDSVPDTKSRDNVKDDHKIIDVVFSQVYKVQSIQQYAKTISTSTIMQQQYFALCTKRSDFEIRLTQLWTEAKDVSVQLALHQRRRNELENRLNDSNQSLTGPAICRIAGGPQNQSLRNLVLLMTLKRSEIQVKIESEQSIIGNFATRHRNVLKDHDRICREADIIDQQIAHITNQISHDTRVGWHRIHEANSF